MNTSTFGRFLEDMINDGLVSIKISSKKGLKKRQFDLTNQGKIYTLYQFNKEEGLKGCQTLIKQD